MKFNFSLLLSALIFFTQLNAEPYLFKKFPTLKSNVPHIDLCDLPTPVVELKNFCKHLHCKNIFMKRDDVTGKNIDNGFRLYGGNKPRKLEFLLADALNRGAKTIITYGCAGSNHALATAVHARELGLRTILMLKDQPNSHVVRHNLLLDAYCGAQLKFFPNNRVRSLAANEILKNDATAYLIPTGGSNPIGVFRFVNAGLELAHQIATGAIEEPDLIYVATGSCATTAGLLLGIKAANLKSKIVAVCVEPEEEKDEFLLTIQKLFAETNAMLNALDASFPLFAFPEADLILNKKFCGTQYGLYVAETMDALKTFKDLEHIRLEGTYSVKPVAAIIDDVLSGEAQGKNILFWNTYCGIDYSEVTHDVDYKKLPQEFHKYFEEDVQPLAKIN